MQAEYTSPTSPKGFGGRRSATRAEASTLSSSFARRSARRTTPVQDGTFGFDDEEPDDTEAEESDDTKEEKINIIRAQQKNIKNLVEKNKLLSAKTNLTEKAIAKAVERAVEEAFDELFNSPK
jgi:hypothetical protein